ncbi:Ig-like domain-containing protein [Cyclobacterium sp. 1_MG-2023]|uniref:Ig-like domain-containing protein n=1 Tax=Cyclobacterium sp. 1_MG-2023 TaxID=3062681 RepID=UPI0026E3ADB8|nr:Ig-like domain-containing protein [Cyclobacterium sp. 1_MG-2023]MDO6435772.1 Ig-like domain-containing protein [Cyclobacterium sp. 1_MG-2023]
MRWVNISKQILFFSTFTILSFILSSCEEDRTVPIEGLDKTNPVIEIIEPLNEEITSETFEVLVEASDNVGIEKVELFLDNQLVGNLWSPPYNFTVNASNFSSAEYTLKAVATDSSDNSVSIETTITLILPTMNTPFHLQASKGEFGGKIVLNWFKDNQAKNNQVFRLNETSDQYELIGETEDNYFVDTTISTAMTNYYYKVRVYNSKSAFSELSSKVYGFTNEDLYDVMTTFGSQGSDNGQFYFNEHVSVDAEDNIYVADANANKIEMFSKTGEYIRKFRSIKAPRDIYFLQNGNVLITRSKDNKISIENKEGNKIVEWGATGNGNGQFEYFRQITVDKDENIFVVDHGNHRIQKFDKQGNFILKWGQNGTSDGSFQYPWGIAVLGERVIVSNKNALQIFDLEGNFIEKVIIPNIREIYDIAVKDDKIYLACIKVIIRTDIQFNKMERIKEDYFSIASGIDINSKNQIIVSDVGDRRIIILDEN